MSTIAVRLGFGKEGSTGSRSSDMSRLADTRSLESYLISGTGLSARFGRCQGLESTEIGILEMTVMPFVSVQEAIDEIRAGRMLVVVDDEDRENEGDLTIAAEKVTPEIINFMATHGRGLICLALTAERCDHLRLPLMSPHNTSNFGTAFCESIDAREGVTTGISAADRTRTILTAIDPATPAGRSGAARPRVSAARPRRRRAGARRADRGFGGSRAPGGTGARRRHLRNHERGRHHGARAAA